MYTWGDGPLRAGARPRARGEARPEGTALPIENHVQKHNKCQADAEHSDQNGFDFWFNGDQSILLVIRLILSDVAQSLVVKWLINRYWMPRPQRRGFFFGGRRCRCPPHDYTCAAERQLAEAVHPA